MQQHGKLKPDQYIVWLWFLTWSQIVMWAGAIGGGWAAMLTWRKIFAITDHSQIITITPSIGSNGGRARGQERIAFRGYLGDAWLLQQLHGGWNHQAGGREVLKSLLLVFALGENGPTVLDVCRSQYGTESKLGVTSLTILLWTRAKRSDNSRWVGIPDFLKISFLQS